jgi:uncharacterized protein YacL
MKDYIEIVLLLVLIGLVAWQRRLHEKLPTATKTRKLVMDTCALIDGRIIELSQSGFVPDELIVPEFVLHELQMLADGGDSHKRERARYGLDVVKELQESKNCTVTIDKTEFERQPNDDKLVALAAKLKAPLYTTDYNLNKLAEIKDVRVLNVNELAQNLRPVALPGEKKIVKILQKGSSPKQGVGYLDDGTMVVVDNAAKLIGRAVEVEVTRVHQTVAGKMIFGELLVQPHHEQRVVQQSTSPKPSVTAHSVASRFRRVRKAV